MSKLYLTTRECAEILEVSREFIRGEIDDGRLQAEIQAHRLLYGRKKARRTIRVPLEQFRAYCLTYHPTAAQRLPAA